MAVSSSILLKGIKGSIGKEIVIKKYGDSTVIARYPDMSHHKATPSQKRVRGNFALAMAYAKKALMDVNLRADYKLKAQNMQRAINVAVKDFYNSPQIHAIDTNTFTGKAGDKIQINATDDFRVASVLISISDLNDSLIESGQAIELKEWFWQYTLQSNIKTNEIKVTATAFDLPGNTTELLKELFI